MQGIVLMAAKKRTHKAKSNIVTVAAAPDLEARRKDFQDTVSGKKKPVQTTHTSQPVAEVKPIGRKRIMGVMIILLLIFVPLMAFAAFYTSYRSSDRVVADALLNTLTADSLAYTAEVTSPTRQVATASGKYSDGKASIDARIRTTYPGELSTVGVSLVTLPKDIYFNIPGASKLVMEGIPKSQRDVYETIQPILKTEIDGNWVHVQNHDVSFIQPLAKLSTCAIESLRLAASSTAARMTLVDLYRQSPFLETKRIKTVGDTGTYQATIDQNRFNEFLDTVTRAGDSVPFGKCAQEVAALKKSALHAAVFEMNINEKDRTIQSLVVAQSGAQPLTTSVNIMLGQGSLIEEPANAVRFDELKTKLIKAATAAQFAE